MKIFILLCLVAVLAFADSQCDDGCQERQCCLQTRTIFGTTSRCVSLTGEGGSCNALTHCGCEEGLECQGIPRREICLRPMTTPTLPTSPTSPTTPTIPTVSTTTTDA